MPFLNPREMNNPGPSAVVDKVRRSRYAALFRSVYGPPYGHNGVFTTLRDVVAFYATRDTNPERWYPMRAGRVQRFDDLPPYAHANVNKTEVPYDRNSGQRPRLSEEEIDAIVTFLRTLTDR